MCFRTTYIVVDCGGGTADFACHKIIDKETLDSVVRPDGGPWGSTAVDQKWYMPQLKLTFCLTNMYISSKCV